MGARLYLGSGLPLGRPRCAIKTALQFAAVSSFIAGCQGWIVEASHHADQEESRFFMRQEILAASLPFDAAEFRRSLQDEMLPAALEGLGRLTTYPALKWAPGGVDPADAAHGAYLRALLDDCCGLLLDSLDGALLTARMQGAFELRLIAGAGHALHEDAPDKVAEAVLAFLSRTGATRHAEAALLEEKMRRARSAAGGNGRYDTEL